MDELAKLRSLAEYCAAKASAAADSNIADKLRRFSHVVTLEADFLQQTGRRLDLQSSVDSPW